MATLVVQLNELSDKAERDYMKTALFTCLIVLYVLQPTQGQGTVYLSNLGQTSTGSDSVGSDSWLAAGFFTGTNGDGYLLDSVQLAMADASGNPDGFTAMIYAQDYNNPSGFFPGNVLVTLNGSNNPSTSGVYSYTPAEGAILSPDTFYFVVLTSGSKLANGAYTWNFAGIPDRNDGWGGENSIYYSVSGSNWNFENSGSAQFAITATAIPEPSMLWLLLLGSGALLYVRRTFQR